MTIDAIYGNLKCYFDKTFIIDKLLVINVFTKYQIKSTQVYKCANVRAVGPSLVACFPTLELCCHSPVVPNATSQFPNSQLTRDSEPYCKDI